MRYQFYQFVCWEIAGKNLNKRIDDVNSLIREFHIHLDNLRFRESYVSAYPSAVDEFFIEEIDTTLLRGKYQIKWEVYDSDEDGEGANRFNSKMRPWLTRFVEAIRLDNGLKYGKKITISVVNSRFQGDVAHGVWPREPF